MATKTELAPAVLPADEATSDFRSSSIEDVDLRGAAAGAATPTAADPSVRFYKLRRELWRRVGNGDDRAPTSSSSSATGPAPKPPPPHAFGESQLCSRTTARSFLTRSDRKFRCVVIHTLVSETRHMRSRFTSCPSAAEPAAAAYKSAKSIEICAVPSAPSSALSVPFSPSEALALAIASTCRSIFLQSFHRFCFSHSVTHPKRKGKPSFIAISLQHSRLQLQTTKRTR